MKTRLKRGMEEKTVLAEAGDAADDEDGKEKQE